uniref:Uncharacterized protein n=1 Tax=Zea mays TaxID=4577 RepID=B6UHT2_MAIZE|nr:hypothetical protein [Zea mays]
MSSLCYNYFFFQPYKNSFLFIDLSLCTENTGPADLAANEHIPLGGRAAVCWELTVVRARQVGCV